MYRDGEGGAEENNWRSPKEWTVPLILHPDRP